MNKNKFLSFVSVLISLTFFPYLTHAQEPNMRLTVISDVHVNSTEDTKLIRALRDLNSSAPDYDAIAVVGDMTEYGIVEEYQAFNSIFQENKLRSAEEFMVMGNHEYFEKYYHKESTVSDEELQSRFASSLNVPGIYYDKWINGYHFIALSGEKSAHTMLAESSMPGDIDSAFISDTQYEWLEETLALDADEDKPIFLFLHQPLENTVYGSIRWNAGLKDTRLIDLLRNYPQVILFSGHSHYILNHPKSIYQDGFTMVNTSSISYTWYEGGRIPDLSQGYVIEVFDDRVEFKAREFSSQTWINTTQIPIPYQKVIGEKNNPYFPEDTKSGATVLNTTSANLTWNPGSDDSVIDRYIVKESGNTVYSTYTNFWNREQKTIEANIDHLSPGKSYSFEIYAVDAWDNISAPLVVNLKMPNDPGWAYQNNKWFYYDEYGRPYEGWLLYQKRWYYLNQDGMMQTGWILWNGKWYYLNNDGTMKTGWIFYNQHWYYLNNSGEMRIGWLYNSGKWYFFANSGEMEKGWKYTGGSWYYLNSSGEMKTGWHKENNKWYYLKPDGAMAINALTIDGKKYFFARNGEWIPGT
jgi:glucan-binding YG repeat protein